MSEEPKMPTASGKAAETPAQNPVVNSAVSTPTPNAQPNQNVFTELFGGDKAAKDSTLMQGVIQKQEDKKSSFFAKKPELEAKKTEAFKVNRSRPGALLLKVAMFALVATGAYFYTQNAAGFGLFGVNLGQKAVLAEEQVNELKAEITVQKNMSAFLYLLEFNSLGDEYFYAKEQLASDFVSQNNKTEYEQDVKDSETKMLELLEKIKENIGSEPSDEEKRLAVTTIENKITELQEQKNGADEQSLLRDVEDYESAKKLIQSSSFNAYLRELNLEKIADKDYEKIMEEVNTLNQSVSAIINTIKSSRQEWSSILEQIELVTKTIDPLFNTEFPGSLSLTAIQFDTETKLITVTGKTNTDDTKNFTLVANLVDAYEDSGLFENAEERSYSKSSSNVVEGEDEKYSSNFKISMLLESSDDANE